MRNLGLLPRREEELHDFSPNELNTHFASVSVLHSENLDDVGDVISTVHDNRFSSKPVTLCDIILALPDSPSQTGDADEITQSVVIKDLLAIGEHLVQIVNSSLPQGVPGRKRSS